MSVAAANCNEHRCAKLDSFPNGTFCDERPDRRPDPLAIRLIEGRVGWHVTMQCLGIREICISNAPSLDALDAVNLDGAQAGSAHLG
jgi:hypothetical protein